MWHDSRCRSPASRNLKTLVFFILELTHAFSGGRTCVQVRARTSALAYSWVYQWVRTTNAVLLFAKRLNGDEK